MSVAPGATRGTAQQEIKPRARIQINAVIQTEGLMGKPINRFGFYGSYSGDRGQPPDCDFVIFHKSRPEVWGSRTVGAADRTFPPVRDLNRKLTIHVGKRVVDCLNRRFWSTATHPCLRRGFGRQALLVR
jgi:hypothetical protein